MTCQDRVVPTTGPRRAPAHSGADLPRRPEVLSGKTELEGKDGRRAAEAIIQPSSLTAEPFAGHSVQKRRRNSRHLERLTVSGGYTYGATLHASNLVHLPGAWSAYLPAKVVFCGPGDMACPVWKTFEGAFDLGRRSSACQGLRWKASSFCIQPSTRERPCSGDHRTVIAFHSTCLSTYSRCTWWVPQFAVD